MHSGSKQKDTFTSHKLQYIESLIYLVGFTIDYTWKMKIKQTKKIKLEATVQLNLSVAARTLVM